MAERIRRDVRHCVRRHRSMRTCLAVPAILRTRSANACSKSTAQSRNDHAVRPRKVSPVQATPLGQNVRRLRETFRGMRSQSQRRRGDPMENYDIRYDDKYGQLTHIDLTAEGAAHDPWFNQTLTTVNDYVVRLAVIDGRL